MPSLTVENYVKAIFQICQAHDDQPAATGQVAETLGVSPGTVTSMLKTLNDGGLATYTKYEGVHLTAAGERLALRVIRRHRLIELFLSRTLQLTWDEVHEEAEHLEHAVSDRLIDRIDAWLDHPEFDPHGDPIPRADGSIQEHEGHRLADCHAGHRFSLSRVLDQSPEFLRYLDEAGLGLGAAGVVVSQRPEGGVMTIAVNGTQRTIGLDAAEKLFVSSEG